MTIDKSILTEWIGDTDSTSTYHVWLPRDCGSHDVRAALDNFMYTGEHERFEEQSFDLPDGRAGVIGLSCAVPSRTGRAVMYAGGEDVAFIDNTVIDAAWSGQAIGEALAAYDSATDLTAVLAAGAALAEVVRAAMIDAPARPTEAAGAVPLEQVTRTGRRLAEAAEALDQAQDEDGLTDDRGHAAAFALATAAHAAAALLLGGGQ